MADFSTDVDIDKNTRFGYKVWVAAIGSALFWMLLIVIINWNNPRTLVSFHGFIHSAIAGHFVDINNLSLPPENPFFAGHPVAYYWFFQYLGAQIANLLGWNIFYSLKAVIVLGTGIMMIFSVVFSTKLFKSIMPGILMGFLIVAGTNPFGFVYAVIKIATQGLQRLSDDPNYLWGVVHPSYGLIRFNDIGGLYGPLFNFFLNMTSRPVALAALVGVLLFLYFSLKKPTILSSIFLLLAVAVTTALSPIIGISTIGGLIISLFTVMLLWRYVFVKNNRVPRFVQPRTVLITCAILILGVLVALPSYYHLIIYPSANQYSFWLFSLEGFKHLTTVIISIVLLGTLAIIGYIRSSEESQPFLIILIIAGSILLLSSIMFLLPLWNQSNFFHAAVVLFAVPASASVLSKKPDNRFEINFWRALVIVLIFLPTLLILLSAYLNRPPVPMSFDGIRPARIPYESELSQLYEWVKKDTDTSSIFVVDPRQRVTMVGNIAEFPAMTNRTLFTENENHYMVSPYSESNKRFDIAVRLIEGNVLLKEEDSYLSGLGRPVYIVINNAGDPLLNQIESLYGLPIFKQGGINVFEWSKK